MDDSSDVVGAMPGMIVYGVTEEQGVAANQLHLIFVPLMTCYGLAFLLVQWNRLNIHLRLARIGFVSLLFLLCAAPLLFACHFSKRRKPASTGRRMFRLTLPCLTVG